MILRNAFAIDASTPTRSNSTDRCDSLFTSTLRFYSGQRHRQRSTPRIPARPTHLPERRQVPAMVLARVVAGVFRARHVRDALCMHANMPPWTVGGRGRGEPGRGRGGGGGRHFSQRRAPFRVRERSARKRDGISDPGESIAPHALVRHAVSPRLLPRPRRGAHTALCALAKLDSTVMSLRFTLYYTRSNEQGRWLHPAAFSALSAFHLCGTVR